MPPSGSMVPTAPQKKNILLVAFAIGLLAPAIIVFLRETMNTRLRGRKDLEALTLPFVGEIPQAATKKKARRTRNQQKTTPSSYTKAAATSSTRHSAYCAPTSNL